MLPRCPPGASRSAVLLLQLVDHELRLVLDILHQHHADGLLRRRLHHGSRGRTKEKRGPGTRRAFSPDTPAVPLQDAFHDRQADAGAGELVMGMQALEDAEQLVDVFHVETGAVVPDAIHEFLGRGSVGEMAADLDPGVAACRRELPRIRQQVGHDLLEQSRITLAIRQRVDADFDGARRIRRPQLVDDTACLAFRSTRRRTGAARLSRLNRSRSSIIRSMRSAPRTTWSSRWRPRSVTVAPDSSR